MQYGTVLFFCKVCHTEVYRHKHVRVTRKPQRQWEEIQKQARLGLLQHMERVGHERASLDGDLWINEESGDDGLEVVATGEKCPAHMHASRVLGMIR